jgi:hypothetical protein
MELNPFLKANSCSALQEFPNILLNPKVHYRVHKSTPLVPILWIVLSLPPQYISLRSILKLSYYLLLGPSSGLFPSGFPTKTMYAIFSRMRATYPTHLILLDFNILTFGEEQK